MKCFYINLDSAEHRRASLEENFQRHKKAGWSLTRVAAVDARYVRDGKIAGALTDPEKACFLSHRKAIGENLSHDENIFILEDDARFGVKTCAMLETLIASADANLEWDLLYTDICVPSIEGMSELLKLRRRLIAERGTTLLDLKPYLFYGATAYVVNRRAKAKLHRYMEVCADLDVAHDNFLRGHIQAGNLKAVVAFPFVTTIAAAADNSSIRAPNRTLLAWNLFRRMVWQEGAWENERAHIEAVSRDAAPEAKAYAALWACMIDPVLRHPK